MFEKSMKTGHDMDIEQESTKTSIENWQDNLNLKADDTADTELTRKPQDVAGNDANCDDEMLGNLQNFLNVQLGKKKVTFTSFL